MSNIQPLKFVDRVVVRSCGAAQTLILRTPIRDVISFRGSFGVYPDFGIGEEFIQDLVVSQLDKGTKHRDRFAIAEIIEDCGAQVLFSSDGYRVQFSGRALREDISGVIRIVEEQLREPLLDEKEFKKGRLQMSAALHRALENTGVLASRSLSGQIYPKSHPNYMAGPEEKLARLPQITVNDIHSFHAKHFYANDLRVAFVGDLDVNEIDYLVSSGLGNWSSSDIDSSLETKCLSLNPRTIGIPVPEKQNIDVRMGHGLPVRRNAADFLPVHLATFVLGGNFSARLMSTIRDDMGLTYGIYSRLNGISVDYDGNLEISVTLSQENIDRGVKATTMEIKRFVDGGITEEELAKVKTTLKGRFQVELATTEGLAGSLLRNAERNFNPDYLDRFPDLLDEISIDQVNDVIKEYIHPEQFQVAMAGMLPDEAEK